MRCMLKQKSLRVFVLLWLCFVWALLCATVCTAEGMYQISQAELSQLSSNLTRLQNINSQQQQTLKEQKSMLSQAKFDLMELQDALKNSKLELTRAHSSLQTANELLEQYKIAEQKRRLRIKRQRNFAYTIATGLAMGLLYKEIH